MLQIFQVRAVYLKKRKDYTFRRQFNEKPSIIPGCPAFGISSHPRELEAERSRTRRCNGLKTKSAEVFESACDQSGAQQNWSKC